MEYTLHLNKEQAKAISRACELLARVQMGQLNVLREYCGNPDLNKLPHIKSATDELKGLLFPDLSPGSYYSLGNDRGDYFGEEGSVCWDLYQVIRNRIAWDENPDGGFQVYFDKPLRTSSQPLAKMGKE